MDISFLGPVHIVVRRYLAGELAPNYFIAKMKYQEIPFPLFLLRYCAGFYRHRNIRHRKAELKDNEVILYFTAKGYDLNLLLKKKDDEHVTGNLLGMFEAEGERVKVSK
ncbi:MAG TPA: hypothetical protein VMY77_16375 [Chitinophagaceae bacterium]|nr:hypothetical protein [Chitinophagaceae bacterium]